MDKETEKWYEEQFELFATEGWKAFQELVKQQIQGIESIRGASLDNLENRQGKLQILDWLVSWEQLCRANFDAVTAEDAE